MEIDNGAPEETTPPDTPMASTPRRGLRRRSATIVTISGLAVGSMLGGYFVANAATSSGSSSSTSTAAAAPGGAQPGPGPRGGGHDQQVLVQAAASAIGISESQLRSEASGGKSIADVAKAHNVDVNTVISAMVTAGDKEVDSDVTAGRLTQSQGDQLKSTMQQHVTDLVNNPLPAAGDHGPGGLSASDLQTVASTIGISTTDLQSALSGGQTIAAVAKAHNVDPQKVIDALVTADQAQLTQHVTDLVNGTRPAMPPDGGAGDPTP